MSDRLEQVGPGDGGRVATETGATPPAAGPAGGAPAPGFDPDRAPVPGLRWLAVACTFAATLAIAALFLPWHGVNHDGIDRLDCVFAHGGCGPPSTSPPTFTDDTGFAHGGIVALVMLLPVAMVAWVAVMRPGWRPGVLAGAAAITGSMVAGVGVALAAALSHMFEATRDRGGGDVFGAGVVATLISGGLLLVHAVWHRPRPDPLLPRARARRRRADTPGATGGGGDRPAGLSSACPPPGRRPGTPPG